MQMVENKIANIYGYGHGFFFSHRIRAIKVKKMFCSLVI